MAGCSSYESVIGHMEVNGIIKKGDKSHTIIDGKLDVFNKWNMEVTKMASEKHGVRDKNGNLLFNVVKKDLLGKISYHAEPFVSLFQELDNKISSKKKNQNIVTEDIEKYEGNLSDWNPVSQWAGQVNFSKELRTMLMDQIKSVLNEIKSITKQKIENDNNKEYDQDTIKKRSKEYSDQITELKKLKDRLQERLPIINSDIYYLTQERNLYQFNWQITKNLELAESILFSDNPSDSEVLYAKKIIEYTINISTIEKGVDNILFDQSDSFDENNKNILHPKLLDKLGKALTKANSLKAQLNTREQNIIEREVNNALNVKKELLYKDITAAMNDTNIADMYTMDITSGIFSENGVLPKAIQKILEDAFSTVLSESNMDRDELEMLIPDLNQSLRQKGYFVRIPGVSGVHYDIFRAKNKNGSFEDTITQRYSVEFLQKRRAIIDRFKSKLKGIYTKSNDQLSLNIFHDAYYDRDRWYRANTVVINPMYLPEIQQFKEYTYEETPESIAHVNKLKEILGDKGYQEEVQNQMDIIKEYLADLKQEETSFKAANELYDLGRKEADRIASETNSSKDLVQSYDVKNKEIEVVEEDLNNLEIDKKATLDSIEEEIKNSNEKDEIDTLNSDLKAKKKEFEDNKKTLTESRDKLNDEFNAISKAIEDTNAKDKAVYAEETRKNQEKANAIFASQKEKLESWKKFNNPFDTAVMFNEKSMEDSELGYTMKYNYSIPKRNESGRDTGYYDERFDIIENDEALKNFHTFLVKSIRKMHSRSPYEVAKNFNQDSLVHVRKGMREILLDENIPFLERISESFRILIEKIKSYFRKDIRDTLSHAKIDPLTGKPQYRVNSSFLKSNKIEINRRYNIELIRLKNALNIGMSEYIDPYMMYNLEKLDPSVIYILAENFNVKPTINALQKRLQETDLTNVNIQKLLKEAITHQVVQDSSFDLPKILEEYLFLTAEYSARQKVLPTLNLLKDHYTNIKDKKNIGNTRTNAIKQMDSWMEKIALNNFKSNDEHIEQRIRNIVRPNLTEKEEVEELTNIIKSKTDGRIYSRNDKEKIKKINDIKLELKKKYENTKDKEEKEQINETLKSLQEILNKLGQKFAWGKIFEAVQGYTKFHYMGWNAKSFSTNFNAGQLSNMLAAESGRYFSSQNLLRANRIILGSTLKYLSQNTIKTKGSKIASAFMEDMRILQDSSFIFQNKSLRHIRKAFFKKLSPYEITRSTEYLNQSPIMISILLETEIIGKDGTKSNVFDSTYIDKNGKRRLEDNFRTQDNVENWEELNGKEYRDTYNKIVWTIINLHGNYHGLSSVMMNDNPIGKALSLFKKWLPRAAYKEWAIEQDDMAMGKKHKGRQRSQTHVTKLLGGVFSGLTGAGVYTFGWFSLPVMIGFNAFVVHRYGISNNVNVLKESLFVVKEMLKNFIKIPLNVISKKQIVKQSSYDMFRGSFKRNESDIEDLSDEEIKEMDEVDISNMRANIMKLSYKLSYFLLQLMVYHLYFDEDDEKDSPARKKYNMLMNISMQWASEANMFEDPLSLVSGTFQHIATLGFIERTVELGDAIDGYSNDHDIILSGPNRGESKAYNSIQDLFFPSIAQKDYGFHKMRQRKYFKHPFDNWNISETDEKRRDISEIKAKVENQLGDYFDEEGTYYSSREIGQIVRKTFKDKQRGESYDKQLKRYKKILDRLFNKSGEFIDSFKEDSDDRLLEIRKENKNNLKKAKKLEDGN